MGFGMVLCYILRGGTRGRLENGKGGEDGASPVESGAGTRAICYCVYGIPGTEREWAAAPASSNRVSSSLARLGQPMRCAPKTPLIPCHVDSDRSAAENQDAACPAHTAQGGPGRCLQLRNLITR